MQSGRAPPPPKAAVTPEVRVSAVSPILVSVASAICELAYLFQLNA